MLQEKIGKVSFDEKEQVTVYLPKELMDRIDILRTLNDTSRTQIFEKMIAEQLDKHPQKEKVEKFLKLKRSK